MLEAVESVAENLPVNSSEPVVISQRLFAVSSQNIDLEDFRQNGQSFSVIPDLFSNGDQNLDSTFGVISLPSNLSNILSDNVTITYKAFKTESLFLRRNENSLKVGTFIISATIVGASPIKGLDPPVVLNFTLNPVSILKFLALT